MPVLGFEFFIFNSDSYNYQSFMDM